MKTQLSRNIANTIFSLGVRAGKEVGSTDSGFISQNAYMAIRQTALWVIPNHLYNKTAGPSRTSISQWRLKTMMFFGGLGMLLGLLVVVGLLALGVWLLAKALSLSNSKSVGMLLTPSEKSSESPLDILKKRYARGEISQAEYEEMRRQLDL